MDNKPQLKVDIPPPRKPPSGGAVAGVGGDDDRPKKNETVRIALRPRPTPTFSPTISDPTPRRQLFPESRLMLGMLSPLLGVFFVACIYFTSEWHPSTVADRLGKFALEGALLTSITLCGVGLLASFFGPHQTRRLIRNIGRRTARFVSRLP
jgi:hypothetical protein